MSVAAPTLRSRLSGAFRAFQAGGVVPQPFADAPSVRGAMRRGRGHAQRVTTYAGTLTGGDTNTEFDGAAKYARYREMRERDSAIAGMFQILEQPYLSAHWSMEGDSDELTEWCATVLFTPPDPQAMRWHRLLEHILRDRQYGCYPFERIAAKDEDGRVYFYLSPRPPDSIAYWYLDGIRIDHVTQEVTRDGHSYEQVDIPGEDLAHFVYGGEANDVEGMSLLRPLWFNYLDKKTARNSRAAWMERAGGVLKLIRQRDAQGRAIPLAKGEDDDAIETAKDFTAHHQAWVMESDALGMEFLQTTSDGIAHCTEVVNGADLAYHSRILADFIKIGTQSTGSYAAAKVTENPFWASMYGYLDSRVDQIHRELLVPSVRFAFGDAAAKECPRPAYSDLRAKTNTEELEAIIGALNAEGVKLTPELEKWILEKSGAPRGAIAAVDERPEPPAPPAGPPAPPSPNGKGGGSTVDQGKAEEQDEDDAASMSALAFADLPEFTVDEGNPRASLGRLVRAPRGVERVLDFADIGTQWEDAERRARALIDDFRARAIADLTEQARKLLARNEPLTKAQVDSVRVKKSLVAEFARKLAAIGNGELDRGRADVAREMALLDEIVGTEGVKARRIVQETTQGYNPTTTAGDHRKVVRGHANGAAAKLASKLTLETGVLVTAQAAQAVPNLRAVTNGLSSLSKAEATAGARMTVSSGYNGGRQVEAFIKGATAAVFSTLFEDGLTCDACLEHEAEVVTVPGPEHDRLRCPFEECLSNHGQNNCRCMLVYAREGQPEAMEEAA